MSASGIPLAMGAQLAEQCERDIAESVREELVVCGTGDHGANVAPRYFPMPADWQAADR